MRVVQDRQRELLEWASVRIPGARFSPDGGASAIGVETEDGRLIGVYVFHGWMPRYRTIEMAVAADDPRWMACRAARAKMWSYVWDVCGVDKLWTATPAKNKRALQFALRMGLKPEAVLYRHYGDDDAVICRMFFWEYTARYGRPNGRAVVRLERH